MVVHLKISSTTGATKFRTRACFRFKTAAHRGVGAARAEGTQADRKLRQFCATHSIRSSQRSKHQPWPNGDAGRGIHAAHHRLHVIADRVQARNRLVLRVQHAGVGVGDQAGGGADVAGVEFGG